MDDRHGYAPYNLPLTSTTNGNGARGVPGHHLATPHPQPPPLHAAAGSSGYYGASAAGQYAAYPPYVDPAIASSSTRNHGGPFSPATTSGTQSRSGSIAGGMQSEASSSSGGGAARPGPPIDMTVNFAMEQPSSGGSGQNPSKRARSDDTGSGPSGGGTPRGLTDKACKTCRVRKVKCDRRWPKCQRCKDRGEECDFGSMVPVDVITDLPTLNADPRVAELENQVVILQMQLSESRRAGSADAPLTPNPALAEAIRSSFLSGTRDAHLFIDRFLAQNINSPLVWGGTIADFSGIGEHSLDWQLARPQLAKALSLHLIHSFFSSCCSFLPIFDPWHNRLPEICEHIDHLDPANQVAVSAFCAMGARASPHSAFLGVHEVGPADPDTHIANHAARAAGVRREQACRSLHVRTYDLCNDLDIQHDASPVNFEALMVELQMLIFNELIPRKSRTLVRLAFGQFQDLQNSTLADEIKHELARAYSLPLFTCDAITSAYARKVPIITVADCRQYLRGLSIPDFGVDLLQRNMEKHIPPTLPKGTLTHEVLVHATHEVHAWLGQAQRTFAEMAVHRSDQVLLSTEIYALWRAVDQIHQASQNLQTTLINLDYAPIACGADGCNDLHLRFITRLDRDTMDITLLIHALIKERKIGGALGASLFLESEKRVRNALKLVSFYSELYITSRDPHMTYHLFWQLELLPDWSEMVMQRFGEPSGPATEALECSEVELDWFVKGLSCAAYYHPIAMGRLLQMEKNRRPPRQPSASSFSDSFGATAPAGGLGATVSPNHYAAQVPLPSPSFATPTLAHPPHTQVHSHPQVSPNLGARIPVHSAPSSGLVGAARTSGTTLVAPVSAAMAGGREIIGGDLQSGVTNPSASKKWGDWSGDLDAKIWKGGGT
ncbi:hypothetical protein BCR35DRAFT_309949 [Leucosporidium creatinivorum]|uniref:Zn(2)-C6 fungal-type domain-containing protein n=1 Tax=Leucosporidium creatinivorum TaxID=106004 RepID=A0A1Y2D9P1_9BASI|nr:hypothetical protein BCR35DRAFT_309949 [Leucosporidium creatinivorum]